ncbi:cytochrome bc1 complex Rieske iron-sulfur subunit [Luteococcus sp. Sow4_B9]|uniref:cytochrome bc1 complex Rieske iron-sulfur subunit n=1 Tax=Luteococcus sp. Sow4_B9 TaxID=3438792 RepID=UPI003F9D9649
MARKEGGTCPMKSTDLETYDQGNDPVAYHPIQNPGLDEHVERWTDANPAAANRVARQIIGMLALSMLCSILFVVVYFGMPKDTIVNFGPFHSNAQSVLLGLTGGLAVLLIGFSTIHWAKQLMNDTEVIDLRDPIASNEADHEEMAAAWQAGVEDSGIGRRKVIGGMLAGAAGLVAIPAVVSLADMGPHPGKGTRAATIEKTIWAEGIKLVNDITFEEIKASDLEIGQMVNAAPANLEELAHEDHVEFHRARAKAAIIIVRMNPDSIKVPESRKDWQVNGILAYSKICTHVGCPISLWEQKSHHLLCPCHQSTFDLGDSGVVVFGPAARALPQLPITVDNEGYLVARSDFTVPVGPSYFERDSRNDYKKGDN